MTDSNYPFGELKVDWPGRGELLAFDCLHPDSPGTGSDLVLDMVCESHTRSVYYCMELGRLYCDGGSVDWAMHDFALLPLPTGEAF